MDVVDVPIAICQQEQGEMDLFLLPIMRTLPADFRAITASLSLIGLGGGGGEREVEEEEEEEEVEEEEVEEVHPESRCLYHSGSVRSG